MLPIHNRSELALALCSDLDPRVKEVLRLRALLTKDAPGEER
jgi:hypothetical protein